MVARIYGMEISTLTSRSRRKVVTLPRNMAMYLCRKHTSASYATIGRSFNRDHATVMYGVNQIDRKIANDPKLQKEMAHIEQRLGVR
jgi:chromosomal replication initiator protein